MEKIASFTVNHDTIEAGLYISRIDGDIVTYDMRTRKPNMGDYMDNLTMHSVEHMFATYIRNSEIGNKVIYFGPMGCQTGFYLLVRDESSDNVLKVIKDVLKRIINHEGEIFGNKREECGNYRNLNLDAAKLECERYLNCLEGREVTFKYE
ncbi:MAG: S-ribosylhomocysteine lyase [Clostridia bacterium]|nr:S-ribosylhomocysteine lyase [Clostridia bacterium]